MDTKEDDILRIIDIMVAHAVSLKDIRDYAKKHLIGPHTTDEGKELFKVGG